MKAIIAIEDTPISAELLEVLLRREWPEHTQIKILTVLPPVQIEADGPQFTETLNKIANNRKHEASHFCDRVRNRILSKDPNIIVHFDIREGSPAAEIIDAAVEWCADKIYIGSHNKDLSGHSRLGSVSQSVALHAPCSVEIVRPKCSAARASLDSKAVGTRTL